MSDYMFMLESHLSAGQNRVVKEIHQAADRANVNLFLTGGAMRDMLGGFPIRDLDFLVEGNASKLAQTVARNTGARILSFDANRKSAELLFPGRVTAAISMARQERYSKVGGKPHVSAATIYEDLQNRDFTFNAIALSLNRTSLGLLIDPNNGLADLEHKEIRAVHHHIFHDDPNRILRMIRFRVRFGFTVEERTRQQYEEARLGEFERHIPPRWLFEELTQIAVESNPGEVLRTLEEEKLLALFSSALSGPKLNLAGFARLQKIKQTIPFGVDLRLNDLGLFLYLLTEKLTPKEKTTLIKSTAMRGSEIALWQKLEQRSKTTEKELKSAKLKKASQIYRVLSNVPGEEVLFLLLRSPLRLVQDRIRNYLHKYLAAAQEITDRQVAAAGAEPGTPKFKKLKEEMIGARLDGRLKKPAPPPEQTAAPEPPRRGRGPYPANRQTAGTAPPPAVAAGSPPRAGSRRS